jgi:hypothetical protein
MSQDAYVDGNALAGVFGELFAVEVTTAMGTCTFCGTRGAIAQTHVYGRGPGMVARCPACGGVLLRLAQGRGRTWLDLRGVTCLELAVPGE